MNEVFYFDVEALERAGVFVTATPWQLCPYGYPYALRV